MKVVVEHTHNFTARLIQFWMIIDALVHGKRPTFTYNHALIEHSGWVWEAIDKGVVRRSLEEHYTEKKYRNGYKSNEYKLKLNAVELSRTLTYLKGQEGKPYEYANFIFHVIKTFKGWKGSKTDKKLYCYELVIRAINASGKYKLDPFLNPSEFKAKLKQL